MVALPALGQLFVSVAKFLVKGFYTLSKVSLLQVIKMTKYALQQSKSFPKHLNGGFTILADASKSLVPKIIDASLGVKLSKLQKEGVLVLKSKTTVEGTLETTIHLVYRESIIATGKSIKELKKKIERFFSGKNGKGRVDIEFLEQESKRILKDFGGGFFEVLPDNLLRKYVKSMLNSAKKNGLNLEIIWITKKHPDFFSKKLGIFKVSGKNNKTLQLHLRPECPKITWFHENWHFEDFLEQGWKKYTEIHKTKPWLHEESVWNKIYKNKTKWREEELIESYLYYKDYCLDRGASPIINSELENLIK